MNPYYKDYAEYMRQFFGDRKVQKVSVNLGATCPNRDGTIGSGGCIYCNNSSFTPGYCFDTAGIREQIEAGKRFFGRKYPGMHYIAYFQSFTSTYGRDTHELEQAFTEAAETDGVAALAIGTRPDCISRETAGMLAVLNKRLPVFVEIGAETMDDRTLQIINRHHDSAATENAIRMLASYGLHIGVHMIAGLPGENLEKSLESIKRICTLPIESIKIHHLQVLKGTLLEKMVNRNEIRIGHPGVEEYLEFCAEAVKEIPRHIAIERFLASAPPALVISPRWGLKNYQFVNMLINKLKKQ